MASNTFFCSICTEIYKDSNNICSTVCGHIFHLNCLQKWQEQCNKCPMCNKSNPQPHRIFLDLEVIRDARANSGTGECKVIIKGLGASELKKHLKGVVVAMAKIMEVSIMKNDIKNVHTRRNTLHIQFITESKKDIFLKNKYKLKHNPQTSSIVVHEVLDAETRDLFEYSHKLKQKGYQTLFVKNSNIFAKKERNSRPIIILSKDQVDTLCQKSDHRTSIPERRSENVVARATANNVGFATSRNLSNTQANCSNRSNNVPRRSSSQSQGGYNYRANVEVAQSAYDDYGWDEDNVWGEGHYSYSSYRGNEGNNEKSGCNIL